MTKSMLLLLLVCASVSIAAEDLTEVPAIRADGGARFEHRGRRDPFTFIRDVPKEPLINIDTKVKRPLFDVQANLQSVEQLYTEAQSRFVAGDFQNSLKACELALKTMCGFPTDVVIADGVRLKSEVALLHRAAQRQAQRIEAQNAFEQLNVKLSGVIARARGSQAILNGNIVREGQVVTFASDAIVIESITDEQVLLNFRGYRMSATMAHAR
jgi:hypothetical protein